MFGGAPICPRCQGKVYFAEEVLGPNGTKYHKACFNCSTCSKKLDSTTLTEREGQIYCKACYGKQFGPKGFGYGLGAGVLTETQPNQPTANKAALAPGPTTTTWSTTSTTSPPAARKYGSGASDQCPRCEKTVYFAEKVLGAGKTWHKLCFTCATCNKLVDSSTVAEKEGEVYCKSCHAKNFGPKGFGFGLGTMETK